MLGFTVAIKDTFLLTFQSLTTRSKEALKVVVLFLAASDGEDGSSSAKDGEGRANDDSSVVLALHLSCLSSA